MIVVRLDEGLLTGGDADEIRRNDLWYRLPTVGCRQRRGRAMLMADLVALCERLSRLGCRQWLMGPLMNKLVVVGGKWWWFSV